MKTKLLWGVYLVCLVAIGLVVLNALLSHFYGLGNPVIYNENPLYGYRPVPNQEIVRMGGKRIKINNVGLRSSADWDTVQSNKMLFLGNSVTYGGSYIDNEELFSTLVTKGNDSLMSASGGVNAWGINNIHGWLVNNQFYPARHYVSVLLEGDFHRGLATITGSYFVTKKPATALHEVAHHYLTTYMQTNQGHFTNTFMSDPRMKWAVQEDAVQHLKEIDDSLKAKGLTHTIFISPSADQVFRGQPIDNDLKRLASMYDLTFTYLLDDLKGKKLNEKEIYHDIVHLEPKGHQVWADLIKSHLTKQGILSVKQ